jgi:site-specific DNA recombinase
MNLTTKPTGTVRLALVGRHSSDKQQKEATILSQQEGTLANAFAALCRSVYRSRFYNPLFWLFVGLALCSASKRALATAGKKLPLQGAPGEEREPYIYVRVSTWKQKMDGFSLPDQIAKCLTEAKNMGLGTIPQANILYDADSGRNFFRESLQELLSRAKRGKVSVVFFPKVDRIGRSAHDIFDIVKALSECGVEVVIVDPKIDTRDPFGKLLFQILAALAELEVELIKDRTMSGKIEQMEQRAASGRAPSKGGRSTPYGLRYLAPKVKGQDGTWELNPEQHRHVLFIFEQTALGRGGETVAGMLNDRGIPGPNGKPWSGDTVRFIVRNTAYIGVLKRTLKGVEYTFPVPRSVLDELFTRANAMIAENKILSPRNSKHEYLLASAGERPLLKCLVCHDAGRERKLGGAFSVHMRDGRKQDQTFYRCTCKDNGLTKRHTVSAQKVEKAVWEALVAMLKDPTLVTASLHKLSDATSREYRDVQQEITGLEAKHAENTAAQERLTELYTRGKLSPQVLAQQEDKLEREASEIAQRLALLQVRLHQAQENTLPIREAEEACKLVAESLEEPTFEDKRWAIRTLVEVIYASRTHWRMEGWLPTLVAEGGFDTGTSCGPGGRAG